MRGAGRGRGPHQSSSPHPGLGNATRPRAPAFRIPGEPGEPGLGAGRGELGFPGPDRGDSPDSGRRRDPTRATLGTPGRDRRRHTPGAMGIPTQGRDPRACSSTLPRDGPRPLSVCEVVGRAAPEIFWSGAFKEPSGTPHAGNRGPELGGFATDCPNAILVRVCGQPRIVAGHLWLSSGRNRGGSRRDRARRGRDPSGRRLAGPSARIAAPVGRAKEGRRSLPPAPPSSSSSSSSSSFSSSSAGDQSWLAGASSRSRRFSLFQISSGNEAGTPRRGTNVVRGARLRPSRSKSGPKEDAGGTRSLIRFELVLT